MKPALRGRAAARRSPRADAGGRQAGRRAHRRRTPLRRHAFRAAIASSGTPIPEGQRNPDFLEQLAQAATKDEPVMFLCRSGVRSHHGGDRRDAGRLERGLQRARRLRRRQGRRRPPQHGRRLAQARACPGCRDSSFQSTQPKYAVSSTNSAERDPVPGERLEVVRRHVADQPADHDERRDERDDRADAEHRRGRPRRTARGSSTGRRRPPRSASAPRGRTRTRSPPGATGRTACRR